MTFPPAFWSWVKWKDAGSKGALPPDVRAYYIARGWNKAPLAWKARYALHTGGIVPFPAPTVDLAPVRNLLVMATVTDDHIREILTLPPRWRVLFSADPVYQPSNAQLYTVLNQRPAWAWCDCHATLPIAAKEMARDRDLSGWYGEGESAAAFDTFYYGGGKWAIVNLSALRADQLALVAKADVLVTEENYRNVRPEVAPDWRNANNGIGSNCGAVYGSSSEGAIYTSAASQIRNGWFGYHDSWYTEGFLAADWQALRALG